MTLAVFFFGFNNLTDDLALDVEMTDKLFDVEAFESDSLGVANLHRRKLAVSLH